VRLTVLGACGAFPEAGSACTGFLLEDDGFRLLLDLGYATVPRLLNHIGADQVDAVFFSHGHPDHCADLNPLLRARAFHPAAPPPLPVYAVAGALDAVLQLDPPPQLSETYRLHIFEPGSSLEIGPYRAETRLLPHGVPNAGVRLTAGGGHVLAYTGDAGPSLDVVWLARAADLLVAEASFPERVPDRFRGHLCSAREAGRQASEAAARRLLLTHLWPGVRPADARDAAEKTFDGELAVAVSDLVVDLG
jgi:ribonuclease BN (tRNA processing enzyme)